MEKKKRPYHLHCFSQGFYYLGEGGIEGWMGVVVMLCTFFATQDNNFVRTWPQNC